MTLHLRIYVTGQPASPYLNPQSACWSPRCCQPIAASPGLPTPACLSPMVRPRPRSCISRSPSAPEDCSGDDCNVFVEE